MKKIINYFFIALIILGSGYYMAGTYFKNKTSHTAQNFNQYNLLAKHSPKFIQIDYRDADKESDGSYTYYTDGYDRQGHHHEVDFNSNTDLKEGQYLKLDTKGNYVNDYQKISANDMPYKVYNIFENWKIIFYSRIDEDFIPFKV